MAEKVTTMVVNTVDLECSSCYKKVKKVLCKFPQIRDQKYDEKNNKVTIRVLCCNPERIRDKLCCKGGKVIKSIEIVEDPPKAKAPEKLKEAEKPKAPEKAPEKLKVIEKPKASEKPKEAEKPKAPEKPKEAAKPKEVEKPKEAEKPKPKAPEVPVPHVCNYPPMPMYPNGTCCGPCSGGGPCYHGYGRPVPPPPGPCYDYRRPYPPPPGPCYDYGYGYRGSRCCVTTDYFSEENPQGCTIM